MPVLKAVQPVGAQKAGTAAAAKVVATPAKTTATGVAVAAGKKLMAPKSKPIETVNAAGEPVQTPTQTKQGGGDKKKGGNKKGGWEGWGNKQSGDMWGQMMMMNFMWDQMMKGGEVHLSAEEISKRKEKLLRAVSARLTKAGGEEPLSAIMGDKEISNLKKNAISNVSKFLREYPQYFEFKYASNPNEGKKDVQVVVQKEPVPEGNLTGLKRKREELPTADCHEALIKAIADTLSGLGNTATVSDIGIDTRVLSAAVNVKDKLGKFMAKYPEVFKIEQEDGAPTPKVTLLVPAKSAVAKANVKAKMAA